MKSVDRKDSNCVNSEGVEDANSNCSTPSES